MIHQGFCDKCCKTGLLEWLHVGQEHESIMFYLKGIFHSTFQINIKSKEIVEKNERMTLAIWQKIGSKNLVIAFTSRGLVRK